MLFEVRCFYFTQSDTDTNVCSSAIQPSTKKKNVNRETNVLHASVTPPVFQADYGMSCYYRKALKLLAHACPSKAMQRNNNIGTKIKHNNSMDTKE